MGKWQDLRTVLEDDIKHWQGNSMILKARDDTEKVPIKMAIAFSVSVEETVGYVLELMEQFDVQELNDSGGKTSEKS